MHQRGRRANLKEQIKRSSKLLHGDTRAPTEKSLPEKREQTFIHAHWGRSSREENRIQLYGHPTPNSSKNVAWE